MDYYYYCIIKSCNEKSKLYKSYLRDQNPKNKAKFLTSRNKLKSLMRAAEKLYYTDLFTSCRYDHRTTWTNIKAIINRTSSNQMSKTFIKDNTFITDPKIIANGFNDYFVNLG